MKVTLFLLAVLCASAIASFPVLHGNAHGYNGVGLNKGFGVVGNVLSHGYNYGYQPYGYNNLGYNGYNGHKGYKGGYNGYNGLNGYKGGYNGYNGLNGYKGGYNGYNGLNGYKGGYDGYNGYRGNKGYNGLKGVATLGHGPYVYNNNGYNSYYPIH